MFTDFLHLLAVALWITVPVMLGGLAHVAVIKLRLLPSLASVRLDLGIAWRGQPLFGENKTLRGAFVMIGATTGFVLLQAALSSRWPWAQDLIPSGQRDHPLLWGLLAGAGYIAGELPNSFVKRRLGVAAGASANGTLGAMLWTIDQVDSLVGVLVFLLPVWTAPLPVVLTLLGVALVVHPLVAFVMLCLGLKNRVG
jgi:hypothetical protein